MIDSKTGLLCLIGNPVEHSLSPIFMNYILEKLDINYRYFAVKVMERELGAAIKGSKALGFRGLNVTIPFKKKVLNFIDRLEEDAEKIGAVNCILNRNGALIGYNTDHQGFIWPLEEYRDSVKGANVLLIGCGGAARGVTYSLSRLYVKSIKIVNRTKENALEFIKWAKNILDETDIAYVGNNSEISSKLLEDIKLIVNTTPLGMTSYINEAPLPEYVVFRNDQIVYDIIYTPWETILLKRARKYGAKIINGFPMLIAQGLYSLGVWFEDAKSEVFSLYDEVSTFAKNYLSGLNKSDGRFGKRFNEK